MTFLRRARLLPARSTSPQPDAAEALPQTSPRRRRLRVAVIAGTAGALALAGTGIAVAKAHKVITLDVDGSVQQISTFAADVDGVLQANEVALGEHDALTPAADAVVADGTTIVVRHAKQLTVSVDGSDTTVWSTSLTADEALTTMALRGDDVHLVASRSSGRAALPVDLAVQGTVDVAVDGETVAVSGTQGLDGVLSEAGVTVGPLDRVRVLHSADGRLTVQVHRVVFEQKTVTRDIDFETKKTTTDELYTDQSRTLTKGVTGERTKVYLITTVDGERESRELLSSTVTVKPVNAVIEYGTKKRPVVTSSTSSGSGSTVGGDVWAKLAQCESGGNPGAVSPNGLYYGLYQFSLPTWRSMGGSGLPTQASAAEQTQRAKALQARSGWGQWPACSAKLGLR